MSARERLLPRRLPVDQIELGRAYLISARNGGVGVAMSVEGKGVGYRLRREKFGSVFLFTEWDWDQGAPYGTAIPLQILEETPPEDSAELLRWLERQEELHREFTQAHWDEVLETAAQWKERMLRETDGMYAGQVVQHLAADGFRNGPPPQDGDE